MNETVLEELKNFFNVKKVTVLSADGVSLIDPAGLLNSWIAFRDNKDNGVYIAFNSKGCIQEVGATVGGKRYLLYPEEIKIN